MAVGIGIVGNMEGSNVGSAVVGRRVGLGVGKPASTVGSGVGA